MVVLLQLWALQCWVFLQPAATSRIEHEFGVEMRKKKEKKNMGENQDNCLNMAMGQENKS